MATDRLMCCCTLHLRTFPAAKLVVGETAPFAVATWEVPNPAMLATVQVALDLAQPCWSHSYRYTREVLAS